MSVTLRVAAWLLLVLVAVVGAQDPSASPASDDAGAETRAASDDSGANPQTRFLPGVGNLISNIFNPCSRCNPGDQQFANRCCQSGERQCCLALQPFGGGGFGGGFNQGFGQGGGFNQGFGGGHGGGFNQGFGQGGFGQGGFGQGGFGQGGFGQGGFGQGGFNNFQQNTKAGFCPKPGLFGGLFSRSNAGGASDSPVGLRSLPGATTSGEVGAADAPTGQAAQEGRAARHARQAPEGSPADPSAAASDDSQPSTRFLPNPFGPGPLIPNPFCRDECFNDFDCPGNLKCCLRDCRKCHNPSFF